MSPTSGGTDGDPLPVLSMKLMTHEVRRVSAAHLIVRPMDARIQIWNVLHDGQITAISEDGDTLTMFVSIPWLRRRLKPLGDSFVLTLAGVRQVECRDFDGHTSSFREELDICAPEIVQTKSESMPLTIKTTTGKLFLDFQSILFALDTGQSVDYETIEKVCREYWAEWEAKSERARHKTSA